MKASERKEALQATAKKGFAPIMAGLGLMAGNYNLVTAQGEDIFAIKEVTAAASGKQYAITLVACVVTELDGSNPAVFGITDADRQLAVTADQWLNLQPNTKYSITVNDKGRVGSIAPYSGEVGEVDNGEVLSEKKEKKEKKDKKKDKATA